MLDSNIEKTKKSRAQRILDDIEIHLRELIAKKKKIYKEFVEKTQELETLKVHYQKVLKEAKRLQNELLLFWDYWSREVEILALDKKLQAGVLPEEREVIIKKQLELVKFNKILRDGLKQKRIDVEIVEEVKKRFGIWEGKEKEDE